MFVEIDRDARHLTQVAAFQFSFISCTFFGHSTVLPIVRAALASLCRSKHNRLSIGCVYSDILENNLFCSPASVKMQKE